MENGHLVYVSKPRRLVPAADVISCHYGNIASDSRADNIRLYLSKKQLPANQLPQATQIMRKIATTLSKPQLRVYKIGESHKI